MADKLGIDFAIIHRKRNGRALTAPEMEMLVGDVEGKVSLSVSTPSTAFNFHFKKVAILVDDMIDTGKTLSLAVKTLHERGARSIVALISHGLSFLPSTIFLTDREGL